MKDSRVIKIVKRTMPSVVSIVIAKHLEDLEKELPREVYPFIPKGRKNHQNGSDGQVGIPDELVDKDGMVEIGGGTGFIVDPEGLVLTNKHVIDEADARYTVILADGSRFGAEVLSRDPMNDVAILKITDAENGNPQGGADRKGRRSDIRRRSFPCLKLGDATGLELGESVVAVGNALGIFRNTVSLGIVSGLSRSITARQGSDAHPQEMRGLIQTDAAINPGNSGGPLVNKNGLVIGINSAIVSGAQSIGFAIPVNAAKRDLDDIKKFGRIRRPFLGLHYIMIDGHYKDKNNLPVDYGAFVIRESDHDAAIAPGSPAEDAGIKEKDIVLSLNGNRLDGEHSISDFLENMNVGESAELSILRNGKEIATKAVLAERK